jgi:hypothetical protein
MNISTSTLHNFSSTRFTSGTQSAEPMRIRHKPTGLCLGKELLRV